MRTSGSGFGFMLNVSGAPCLSAGIGRRAGSKQLTGL
jgi:hypothetical protein